MDKKEFLKVVDKLNFDKSQYCIISGGVMLMYGLKNSTDDVDLKILPELYEKLKNQYNLIKSSKMDNLYELEENIELKVEYFSKNELVEIEGYPVLSLQAQKKWILENNRRKDDEKLVLIDNFLKENN